MENYEAELYIFGPDDQLITTITEETGLYAAPFKEGINQVSSFSFTVDATAEAAAHVVEENQVVFRDKEGDFRLFVIKEPMDRDGPDGPETEAVCEPWYMELKEHIVLDRRFVNQTADVALNAALEGTRATGRVIGEFGRATTNFYRLPAIDAIWEIPNVWGGELKDVVEFDGSRITARRMELHMRRGADRGKVFEIDHDIEEIERTVLSYPLTAMYGWGASLEIEDEQGEHTGGYTRYIDFADVEWSKAKGDPVDKPKGQKWVGDPVALQRYGRLYNGKRLHREGQYRNHDIEDPAELLEATWLHLQDVKEPEVSYRLSVALLERLAGYEHEHVQLGDTAAAIDREFSREIVVQSRVISIEYDILDIEGTAVVEMGQFLSVHDQNLGREIDDLKAELDDTRAQANRPITNDRFLDIKPGTPSNLQAVGGFQVIQLYWNYDSNVNIAHYEVYGSQVASFVPDAQHLLWRGRTSAFAHEVHTDETWYYYVRAVNQRGTPGGYSVRASAATVRLISDDILFGTVTAEHLAGNLDIADKLAQNTVDRINARPMEEIGYTRDEITAAETRLNTRLNNEIGDVNGAISTLTGRADALSKRADAVDASLTGHGNRLTEVETEIDTVNGKISASLTSIERIDGTVNQHTATLSAQATAIAAKVDNLTYQRDMSGAISRIDSAETSIDILASGLELRVTKEEFEALEVGGRNLLLNSQDIYMLSNNSNSYPIIDEPFLGHRRLRRTFPSGVTSGALSTYTLLFFPTNAGETYTMSIKVKPEEDVRLSLQNGPSTFCPSGVWTKLVYSIVETTSKDRRYFGLYGMGYSPDFTPWIEYKEAKVERGTIASDWTPAPEDTNAAITSVSNRVTNTETTLQVHAGQISAKAERTEVYTKTEINTALGKKVDTTVYNTKMGQLDVSINGITGRVASTETNINTLTGQMQTATSNIAALDVRADGIVQSVSSVQSEMIERTTVKDTRSTNQPPSFYWSNHKKQIVEEFKTRTVIGAPGSATYGNLTTHVYYSDRTGGPIKQEFRSADGLFERQSVSDTTWTAWREIEDTAGAQNKVNTAVGPLNTRITSAEASIKTLAGEIELRATKTTVDTLNGRMDMAEGRISVLSDEIDLRVTKNGIIAGINITPESIRINGAKIHLTGQTLIDDAIIGTAALANAAITNAKIGNLAVSTGQIQNGAITNAKIGNLAVDDAKIASLSATKLIAGTLDTGKVKIYGGSAVDYTTIDGSYFESRGRFTRTWRGASSTHDIKMRFENGYLRARNDSANRSLYFSDFGISTQVDGINASGTLEFFSKINSPLGRGVTLTSEGVTTIEANGGSIFLSPGANSSVNSTGAIWAPAFVTTTTNAYIGTDGVLHVVNKGYADGSGGSPIYRDVRANRMYAGGFITGSTHAYIGADGELRVVNKGLDDIYRDVRGLGFIGNRVGLGTHISGIHFHVQPSLSGEVRITDRSGNGSYRPIRALQFVTDTSVRSNKKDIEHYTEDTLAVFRNARVYTYHRLNDEPLATRQLGLMIDELPSVTHSEAGDSFELYGLTSYAIKGIKDLIGVTDNHEERIGWLELENQHLKQKIKELECA